MRSSDTALEAGRLSSSSILINYPRAGRLASHQPSVSTSSILYGFPTKAWDGQGLERWLAGDFE